MIHRFRSNDGHYYIVANVTKNYVTWGREEGTDLIDVSRSKKSVFYDMIKSERWIEETEVEVYNHETTA